MALSKTNKRWIVAILLMALFVFLVDYLISRR